MGWGVFALLQYLRAAVTHGKRGEHKPRNGDRIHMYPYFYFILSLCCLLCTVATDVSYPSDILSLFVTFRHAAESFSFIVCEATKTRSCDKLGTKSITTILNISPFHIPSL